jgi:hypothetical protein
MAKNLAQNFSIDLSNVVDNAITAVKTVRRREQARKEAEFQRAIANGLSYEEQLKMREKWLEDEKSSGFPDNEYIDSLTKSISDTKKLARFQNYRNKYVSTLNELNAGKINEEKYLNELQRQLDGVTDPELRLEIQGDIATATKQVKTYHDTILQNQVTFAQKDGTARVLNDAISRVKAARASANINDNEDEVLAYDEALLALDSQLNTVRVEDKITNFQTKSATLGVSPIEKLDFINSEIQNADDSSSFRIGEKTYSSAREYWQLQRDQYLAGKSETLGGNFFEELNVFTDGQISKDSARFGYTSKQALDDVMSQYEQLSARPEMTPFLVNLNNTRTSSMNGVVLPSPGDVPAPKTITAPVAPSAPIVTPAPAAPVSTPAETPVEPVSIPESAPAETVLGQPLFTPGTGIGTKSADGKFVYTESGWIPLTDSVSEAPQYTPSSGDMTLSSDGKFIYREGKGWEPVSPLGAATSTPTAKAPIPAPEKPAGVPAPITPATIPSASPAPIAQASTSTPPSMTPLSGVGTRSPDGKFVFTEKGWESASPIAPLANVASPFSAIKSLFGAKNQPAVATPVTPVTPVAPTAKPLPVSTYKGSSIVDYLRSIGEDTSDARRAALARERGIVKDDNEYLKAVKTGKNAAMNTKLLDALRKESSIVQ